MVLYYIRLWSQCIVLLSQFLETVDNQKMSNEWMKYTNVVQGMMHLTHHQWLSIYFALFPNSVNWCVLTDPYSLAWPQDNCQDFMIIAWECTILNVLPEQWINGCESVLGKGRKNWNKTGRLKEHWRKNHPVNEGSLIYYLLSKVYNGGWNMVGIQ